MFSKNKDKSADQGLLFNTYLKDIISLRHPLAKLANAIDWASFDDGFEECFCNDNGRPSLPTRQRKKKLI